MATSDSVLLRLVIIGIAARAPPQTYRPESSPARKYINVSRQKVPLVHWWPSRGGPIGDVQIKVMLFWLPADIPGEFVSCLPRRSRHNGFLVASDSRSSFVSKFFS